MHGVGDAYFVELWLAEFVHEHLHREGGGGGISCVLGDRDQTIKMSIRWQGGRFMRVADEKAATRVSTRRVCALLPVSSEHELFSLHREERCNQEQLHESREN